MKRQNIIVTALVVKRSETTESVYKTKIEDLYAELGFETSVCVVCDWMCPYKEFCFTCVSCNFDICDNCVKDSPGYKDDERISLVCPECSQDELIISVKKRLKK